MLATRRFEGSRVGALRALAWPHSSAELSLRDEGDVDKIGPQATTSADGASATLAA
jgi:hypothetical protein